MNQEMQRNNRRIAKSWLKRELAPFRVQVIALTVLAACTTAIAVLFSFFVRYLVNGVTGGKQDTVIFYAVLLLCLLLSRIILQTSRSYASEQICAKMTASLLSRTFSLVLRAQYAQLEKYHSEDLLTRMTNDVGEVANDSVSLLPASTAIIVQALGATVALFILQPILTAILLCCGVLAGFCVALCRKQLKILHREITEKDGENRAFIQESISSVVTVKSYLGEQRAESKSKDVLEIYRDKRKQRNVLRTSVNGMFSFMAGAAMLIAILWCGIGIAKGECDFGSLFAILLLLGQLERPFASFSAILPTYYARESAAERLAELDEIEQELIQPISSSLIEEIVCTNLCFRYSEQDKEVLKNASIRIIAGERICIVGESGSGKSTLCKLLLSMYPPSAGRIIKRTREGESSFETSDRWHFAYVPQGNYLFSGTIRENLCFFAPAKTNEGEIETALTIACAKFVYDLPDGLETCLQERGGGLSEGQIQRIAIARALLSERQILLLDEATSALDQETEKQLLCNLKQTQKTCIMVTHRPQALDIADKVYRIQDGQISEETK